MVSLLPVCRREQEDHSCGEPCGSEANAQYAIQLRILRGGSCPKDRVLRVVAVPEYRCGERPQAWSTSKHTPALGRNPRPSKRNHSSRLSRVVQQTSWPKESRRVFRDSCIRISRRESLSQFSQRRGDQTRQSPRRVEPNSAARKHKDCLGRRLRLGCHYGEWSRG